MSVALLLSRLGAGLGLAALILALAGRHRPGEGRRVVMSLAALALGISAFAFLIGLVLSYQRS